MESSHPLKESLEWYRVERKEFRKKKNLIKFLESKGFTEIDIAKSSDTREFKNNSRFYEAKISGDQKFNVGYYCGKCDKYISGEPMIWPEPLRSQKNPEMVWKCGCLHTLAKRY